MKLQIHILLLTLLVLAGCRKQDIEPEPVGDPVPHEAGPDKTWQQLTDRFSLAVSVIHGSCRACEEKVKQSGTGFRINAGAHHDKAFRRSRVDRH